MDTWRHLILGAFVSAVLGFGQRTSQLERLIEGSEVVAVAEVRDNGFDGTGHQLDLTLVNVLKGDLLAGTVAQVRASPKRPDYSRRAPTVGQGLVFLNSTESGWRLNPVDPLGPGIDSLYLSLPGLSLSIDSPSGAKSIVDRVALELASRVELEGPAGSARLKFFSLVPFWNYGHILQKWAASESPFLRVNGLAGLIASRNSAAILRAVNEWDALAGHPDSGRIHSALSGIRSTDGEIVRALGRLATSPTAPKEAIEGLSYALFAIHTADALPFLAELLASPNKLARPLAVAGFSAFVTNMRRTSDGLAMDEARDEVANPGRRRKLPSAEAPFETEETRRHTHFGPFRDAVEEAKYVAFWKSWYERNKNRLTSATSGEPGPAR